MTRISIFIKDSDLEELKNLSKETGAPVSELIRRSIKKYLEDKKEK